MWSRCCTNVALARKPVQCVAPTLARAQNTRGMCVCVLVYKLDDKITQGCVTQFSYKYIICVTTTLISPNTLRPSRTFQMFQFFLRRERSKLFYLADGLLLRFLKIAVLIVFFFSLSARLESIRLKKFFPLISFRPLISFFSSLALLKRSRAQSDPRRLFPKTSGDRSLVTLHSIFRCYFYGYKKIRYKHNCHHNCVVTRERNNHSS